MSIMERVEALRRMGYPESLDEPMREDSDATRADFLEGTYPSPHDFLEADELEAVVDTALRGLTPREERVVRLRFGIGVDESVTLDAAGEEIERTRERARQIEASALGKLRRTLPSILSAPVQPERDEAAPSASGTSRPGCSIDCRAALARKARVMVHGALRHGEDPFRLLERMRTPEEFAAMRDELRALQSDPAAFAREQEQRAELQRRARVAVAEALARGQEPAELLRTAEDEEYVAELVDAIREARATGGSGRKPRRTRISREVLTRE